MMTSAKNIIRIIFTFAHRTDGFDQTIIDGDKAIQKNMSFWIHRDYRSLNQGVTCFLLTHFLSSPFPLMILHPRYRS